MEKSTETYTNSDDILILNVDSMDFIVSKIKSPVVDIHVANAVITRKGYVHLFTHESHWKIHITEIIKPSDMLIFGYVKECGVDIPNDITKEIVEFYGALVDQY